MEIDVINQRIASRLATMKRAQTTIETLYREIEVEEAKKNPNIKPLFDNRKNCCFLALPSELSFKLYSLLGADELCQMALVTKDLWKPMNDPELWEALCKAEGAPAPEVYDPPCWKLCYFHKVVKKLPIFAKKNEKVTIIVEGIARGPTAAQSQAGVTYMVEVTKWVFGDLSSLSLRLKQPPYEEKGVIPVWHEWGRKITGEIELFWGQFTGCCTEPEFEKRKNAFPLPDPLFEKRMSNWVYFYGNTIPANLRYLVASRVYADWLVPEVARRANLVVIEDIFTMYAQVEARKFPRPLPEKLCGTCKEAILDRYYRFGGKEQCPACCEKLLLTNQCDMYYRGMTHTITDAHVIGKEWGPKLPKASLLKICQFIADFLYEQLSPIEPTVGPPTELSFIQNEGWNEVAYKYRSLANKDEEDMVVGIIITDFGGVAEFSLCGPGLLKHLRHQKPTLTMYPDSVMAKELDAIINLIKLKTKAGCPLSWIERSSTRCGGCKGEYRSTTVSAVGMSYSIGRTYSGIFVYYDNKFLENKTFMPYGFKSSSFGYKTGF